MVGPPIIYYVIQLHAGKIEMPLIPMYFHHHDHVYLPSIYKLKNVTNHVIIIEKKFIKYITVYVAGQIHLKNY